MTRAAPVPSAPSALRRVRDVAAIFARHGLADLAGTLHLGGAGYLRRTRADAKVSLSRPARLRLALEELGPTFVKFGQALSLRPDVVAPALVLELSKLQDRATPLQEGEAEAVVVEEFQRPLGALFAAFERTPHAAGSMAQVHRALLATGEPVAVKIRRPGIASVIESDLEILRQTAHLIEQHLPTLGVLDPVGLVHEFARTIRAEQDLRREGRNLDRFGCNFSGDSTVRFPRVYWDRTSAAVLTMEFLEGRKLSEFTGLATGPFVRRLVATRGADAMLRQFLEHGFFHADPHPGNILVLPGNVIGFLDLGMVGHIDESLRDALAEVVRAIGARDAGRLGTVALRIGRRLGEVDGPALERDLEGLIDTYADMTMGELSMAAVLRDVVATAAAHRLQLPSNLMLLIKSVVTIESVGQQLDPGFRMVEHAKPFAERLWHEHQAPGPLAARAVRQSRLALRTLADLPGQALDVLRNAGEGRLQVQFVHKNLEHFVREMDRSSNRISFAIVIAAIVVGSSLVTYRYPMFGLAGFLMAALLGLGLAVGIVRSGRL